MIAHRLQLLYLHPSKTGGTSVEQALLTHEIGNIVFDKLEYYRRQMYSLWTDDTRQHWGYDKMVDAFPFLSGWKSIVTVRNPYDRLISEFRYQQSGNRTQNSEAHENDDINLAIRSRAIQKCANAYHWVPQIAYIGPETTILRLENLANDWNDLNLGLPKLPHSNRSSTQKRYDLDEGSKEIIYEQFKDDFEALGYAP